MAKVQVKRNKSEYAYEFNSHWYYNDVSTDTYFDILCDYDIKHLISMVQHPMVDTNNERLREISRRFYSSNGIVRNAFDYMQALPSLDYIVTSYSKDSKSKLNKEIVRYVMKKIRHKRFIRDAILKGCIDGVAFYYLDTGKKRSDNIKFMSQFQAESITEVNALKPKLASINASIKSLPTNYCRIVGMMNNSYAVAFDLSYFDIGNESAESKLKKYPAEFATAYQKWKSGKSESQMLILDNTKTIVHKISSNLDEPWGRPLTLAAIRDILYSDYFINTKRNVLERVNNKIIYEKYPEGKTQGTSALTKEQQREQHDYIQRKLQTRQNHNGVVFFSVAAGTELEDIDVNTDLFDSDYENKLDIDIGTDLGFAVSLLNANGGNYASQQNNLELVTARIFEWIDDIVAELNKVINYNILNLNYVDVEVNYLPITHLNRDKHFKTAKDLLTIGRGTLSYLSVCAGIPKEVYFAMLDEQLEEGVMDKYPINATSYNTSGENKDDGSTGRPTTDDPTNDNTIKSKANNSNDNPKPST